MRKDWEVYSIKDLGKVITGSTPSTKDDLNYSSNDYSFVKPSDIPQNQILYIDNTECYVSEYAFKNSRILPSGTVLVTCIGIIGKVGITKNDCICNQQINAIIPNDKVNNKFLAYSIFAKREVLSLIANSPVVPIINKNDFSNIKLQLPTLQTQQQIVEELDSLTSIIEKHKKQLEELDTLAQSIFYDMFGDPITNEKGWKQVSLVDICKNTGVYGAGSSSMPKQLYRPRYVRITDILDSGDLNDDFVVSSNVEDDETYRLNVGDILFARSGATVGKTYLYRGNEAQIYAGYLIKFSLNILYVNPIFIFYITKNRSYKLWISKQIIGVAQPNINAQKYGKLPIILPPLPLQQQFASKIESIEKQKELIKQSLSEVQQLFDSRMDYYFG